MLKTIVSKELTYEFTRVCKIVPDKAIKTIGEIYPYEKTRSDF